MVGLARLRIKSKVMLVLLIVSLGSAAVMGLLTWQRARNILTQRIFDQLTSVRAAKAAEIESYFQFMYSQVETLAEDRMIVSAMGEFDQAFDQLNTETAPLSDTWQKALRKYYNDEFFPRLSDNIDGTPIFDIYRPGGRAAQVLQYGYIANNPYPVGSKDNLLQANDGTTYSTVHNRYHRIFRNLVSKFGYYDLFLIDHKTGDIVYSVYKETDFATSLDTGPYARSNFAEVIDKVQKNPEPGAVQIVDFAPYRPSYGAPAAFFASPIYADGQQVGILAVQLPVDRINNVLTGNQNWENEGLGQTGEVYLVGADLLMRSISRFLIEDPTGYKQALRDVGTPETIVETIGRLETSILLQSVDTEGAEAAQQGKTGTQIIDDYRGVPVLSSYAPLNIKGVDWVILSEMDLAEAYAPLTNLQGYILITAVILVFLVTLIAVVAANSLVRPISLLVADSHKIISGELDQAELKATTEDELSLLVDAFNEINRSLREQQSLLATKDRENTALLLNVLPTTAAERLANGEALITDHTQQTTVLVASLEGLTELSAKRSVSEVTRLLTELFSAFDEVATGLDVLALDRIGDLYFAVCGLTAPRMDHTKRVVDLGLEMMNILQRFNNKYNPNLKLCIGIDAGESIAAVIDTKRLNYHLWGETLAIAHQLNRVAKSNTIRVTEEVHDSVRDLYTFRPAEDIEVNEVGRLTSWVLYQGGTGRPSLDDTVREIEAIVSLGEDPI
ncbi:adenylate/guanylate cyclase domain-containing protein [Leptolyngbya cf. ectocarpi LEGE 11479]|uniref:Adenylate/guanylate cyclase domain-containing protein n=1 Tax=Leptolyngbya cf. ectocarpi LEGE 11479 TaxID=1828722 RepID=A0A928X2Q6_LEPEC|nr:adenylate/guanylate cyclase domain-containing protein [Leptolyngbya ectocarpi]MBE9066770.1 adenylate/guanylate cyclase domain-containing protein [Leptolyngbya cf. ectocarpi LEGE 11479]